MSQEPMLIFLSVDQIRSLIKLHLNPEFEPV
jgi:hypothetical protein